MPTRKGKHANKKDSDGDDVQINQIDVQYNPDIIASLIHELQIQVDSRCNQIQKDSDFMITSIQQAFHLEMIKLPSQVKNMSMKRFKEEFGESLEAVINAPPSSHSATMTKFRGIPKPFQTPSHKLLGAKPMTAMRNPKEGEVILSANGSPLGEFTTIRKPANPNANSIAPPTPQVYVPLKNGEMVDIENADLSNLDEESRKEALVQMEAAMLNMRTIMSKLRHPPTSY